jgi:CDP-diacylglycerol---serine O-phosphatidyltransferase
MRKNYKKDSHHRIRGIYILPNLFTSASLFGGFYAIIASIQGRFEAAATAIILSAICDGLDGRVARFTNTTSDFGAEYDSLSDLVAFGVAPAILSYLWALKPFGRLGWIAAFMFAICGALRLARFNVEKTKIKSTFFKGLPIPSAACFIASLILFATHFDGFAESRDVVIIVMIYGLSFLMVSSIYYPSFKEFNIKHQKPFNILVSSVLILLLVAYKPKILLFLILFTYVCSGPVITVIRHYKKQNILSHKGLPEENDENNVMKN